MNLFTDLSQILIGELGGTTRIFLVLLKNSKLSWLTFKGKTSWQEKLGYIAMNDICLSKYLNNL